MTNKWKKIEMRMIEWRGEDDGMYDGGRMMKNGGNQVIKKLSKDERLFKENRKNLKYKKENRFYTIYGGTTR